MSPPKRIKLDQSGHPRLQPVLSDDLVKEIPLTEVYIDEILDPKSTSKVIVQLNSVLPIPDLNHLKRVKGRNILLFPVTFCPKDDVRTFLENKNFNTKYLANNIGVINVAKVPPKVRKQYDVVNKLWPCNFHSDKYLEKLCTNTLFSEDELEKHENYMRVAVEVSKFVDKSCATKNSNGVVIIDPKIDSIVAVGYDNLEDGPCQHGVMVAIDNVAKTQNGGAWSYEKPAKPSNDENINLNGLSENMLIHLRENFNDIKFGASKFKGKSELEVPSDGPYLCTGYYAYSIEEPCIMCAMALVHSRIKRVFYGISSKKGGLGTLCKVHTVKDLNHHFEVFSGLLKDECVSLKLNT